MELVSAPRRIAVDLQVEPNDRLVRIERVTHANGTPIALMTNYLVPSIAPGIEKRIGGMNGLYAFLESEYNLVIEAATDYISARDATPAEAERLQIPEHSPLLVVRRITHSGGRARRGGHSPGGGGQVRVLRSYQGASAAELVPLATAGDTVKECSRMTLTARDVAQLIDISAVQAPHGAAEIRGLVDNAKKYHFIAVHVLPCWVSFLRDLLVGSPDILIGAPVGSPVGRIAPRSRPRKRSSWSRTASRKWT